MPTCNPACYSLDTSRYVFQEQHVCLFIYCHVIMNMLWPKLVNIRAGGCQVNLRGPAWSYHVFVNVLVQGPQDNCHT